MVSRCIDFANVRIPQITCQGVSQYYSGNDPEHSRNSTTGLSGRNGGNYDEGQTRICDELRHDDDEDNGEAGKGWTKGNDEQTRTHWRLEEG